MFNNNQFVLNWTWSIHTARVITMEHLLSLLRIAWTLHIYIPIQAHWSRVVVCQCIWNTLFVWLMEAAHLVNDLRIVALVARYRCIVQVETQASMEWMYEPVFSYYERIWGKGEIQNYAQPKYNVFFRFEYWYRENRSNWAIIFRWFFHSFIRTFLFPFFHPLLSFSVIYRFYCLDYWELLLFFSLLSFFRSFGFFEPFGFMRFVGVFLFFFMVSFGYFSLCLFSHRLQSA